MKKLILLVPLVMATAACETRTGNIAGGAAIGAAVNEDDRLEGAAVGAAAGAVVAAVEESRDGQCLYRNTTTGETYYAECP